MRLHPCLLQPDGLRRRRVPPRQREHRGPRARAGREQLELLRRTQPSPRNHLCGAVLPGAPSRIAARTL
jgi:hypothetical protein